MLHFTLLPLKKPNLYTQFLMLIGHKRFSDEIRQRFNKCTVYNANGSGGIRKGQKREFVQA